MTKRVRLQLDFSVQAMGHLDEIVEATGLSRREVLLDALYHLRESIFKSQEGYQRLYRHRENPKDVIQIESKYDYLRLPK